MKKIILILALLTVSCSTATVVNTEPSKPSVSPSPVPVSPTPSPVASVPAPAQSDAFDPKKDYQVNMETTMGTIKLKLFPQEAPKASENFVGLINKKYYDGITFHRVIDNFMIQGGDPTATGTGGQSIFGKEFEDEFSPNLKFDHAGILAMANAGPNTNGSQFFITINPSLPKLNNGYTIFGEVTEGQNVVDAIGKVTTNSDDKPLTDVKMTKVTVTGK